MQNALKDWAIDPVLNAVAAGTSNQTATHVDMQGYEGVVFIGFIGTLTATQVTAMKAQYGAVSDDSDMADITSGATAAMADGDSNKLLVIDIVQPSKRYVRVLVTRGTANAVINGVIAIRYVSGKKPVAQAAASISQSLLLSNP